MKLDKEKLLSGLERAEDFFFGSHACLCCRRECDSDNPYRICLECLKKIEFNNENYCLRCGTKIKDGLDFCAQCSAADFNFDYARSVFVYNEVSSPIILRFKYNGYKTYRKPLGKMLADYFSTSDILADVVTYVPMPSLRERERGYNQAKELALEFSELTGMRLVDALVRIKESPKQATLSAEERLNNLRGSFAIIDKSLVKGKDVLLIDDVMTTGATANECAKVLNKAGARSVIVLTLAKTRLNKLNFEL